MHPEHETNTARRDPHITPPHASRCACGCLVNAWSMLLPCSPCCHASHLQSHFSSLPKVHFPSKSNSELCVNLMCIINVQDYDFVVSIARRKSSMAYGLLVSAGHVAYHLRFQSYIILPFILKCETDHDGPANH